MCASLFLVTFMMLGTVEFSRAETSDSDQFQEYTLGQIVVTEARPGAKDTTVTNEITADEIKATNSKTVADALRFAPGVIVTTGVKNIPNISIRGFSQDRILVLVDGVPYYETKYGKLDLNQIPADIISKIEVVKGASSVLYGSNAEGGVINIITKKGSVKPSFTGTAEIGENNTYRLSVSHGMQKGMLNYWIGFTHRQSDGWRMSDDYDASTGTIYKKPPKPASEKNVVIEDGGVRDNSDYRSDALWTRIGVEPDEDAEYYLTLHYVDSERGMPANIEEIWVLNFDPAFSRYAGRIENEIDWGADLSGRQKINDLLTLRGKLFYHNHRDDYVSYDYYDYPEDIKDPEHEIARSRYKDYLAGGSLFTDLDLTSWYQAHVSLHYKGDSHKQRGDDDKPYEKYFSYTGSVGIENNFTPEDWPDIVIGCSYDWFQVTQAEADPEKPGTMSELNPMIGVNYVFEDSTRVFGSVAKKTRFPTLDQLYGRYGNPDLKAEKSINYTLGVNRNFANVFDLEVAGFFHDISDWITNDASDDGKNENYGKIHMLGVEVNAKYYPIDDLTLSLDYTYNYARDRSDDRVTDRVVDIPEHKLGVGLDYLVPTILTRIQLRGIYIGQRYSQLPTVSDPDDPAVKVNDSFVLNSRISREFAEHYEAYLEVNNVFDTDYESEENYPGPGRNFLLGITARF
jgi:iron complex outermembrane receptor protein